MAKVGHIFGDFLANMKTSLFKWIDADTLYATFGDNMTTF